MTKEQIQLRLNEIVAEYQELQGRLKQINDEQKASATEAVIKEQPAA